ncbi:Ig-like domain-containing protein [Luteolibacter arcticus]|uniref:Ig-like domain-containing protein n=1 Tax=Luteolibacter arcticus TaxID=1581411 RepID=A0ABT3GK96_9BACT|nr:LamG-like jellyroll fold domain-containing protein [Luteolibacter arcticus]MCW1923891.1 Ig-like domain-containing protein [Luteolibacter arcticus]
MPPKADAGKGFSIVGLLPATAISIIRRVRLAYIPALSLFTANAATLPDDVLLKVTVSGTTKTLNLHKRTTRAKDFKLFVWDATNGYKETPSPEVRTFRGTVTEDPNALVVATIDSKNIVRAYCFDMEQTPNTLWYAKDEVASQLADPRTPSPMPPQAVAAPRGGSGGLPLIGPKLPAGTSAPVGDAGAPLVAVNYGDIVAYELGADLPLGAYNHAGGNVEDTLLNYELEGLIYEQMLLRSCLVLLTHSTVVVRKEKFYGPDPGDAKPYLLGPEWNRKDGPLRDARWDCMWGWGQNGGSSSSSMGHGHGVGAGALYHENTHNWSASHLGYQADTQGGNHPSIGPITGQRMLEVRRKGIDAGWFPKADAYPDPVFPYTHPDAVRVSVDTARDIDVLANDWDANGDQLTISEWTRTTRQGGSVARNEDGTLHYVPAPGFVGKDVIVYTAQDDSVMKLKTKDLVHIEVVNNGLMAEYKFDETTGNVAKNSAPHAHASTDASILSGNFATDSVPAPMGRGVFSPGNVATQTGNDDSGYGGLRVGRGKLTPNDLVLDGRTPFENAVNKNGCCFDPLDGDQTFETWYRCDDYSLGNAAIVSKGWGGEQNYGWNMGINPVTGCGYRLRTYWHPFHASAPKKNLDSPVQDFVPGRWYHIVSVFDRTLNEVRLYLDGVKVATQANAFSPGDIIFDGRRPVILGGSQKKRHCLSNTRIYSRALSDPDVQARYGAPGKKPKFLEPSIEVAVHTDFGMKKSLWAWIWTGVGSAPAFSKVSGPAWLSVNANGELTGRPSTSNVGLTSAVIRMSNEHGASDLKVNLTVAPARLRARWHFDEGNGSAAEDSSGNGKTLTLAGATWKRPSREGAFSLAFEGESKQSAEAPALDVNGGFTIAVWINPSTRTGKDTIISQQGSYAFKLVGSALELGIPKVVNQTSGGGHIVANRWQHVAVSFVPGDPEGIKFYVNGSLKATKPASDIQQTDHPTLLGKSVDWVNDYFDGGLDDMRVYGTVLGREEIRTLAAEYPTCTAPVLPPKLKRPLAIPGEDYHATLAGSAVDPDACTVLSYAKVSGPDWLKIAPDGTLGGKPSASDIGMNSFDVSVTDVTGLSDTGTLNIPVNRFLAAHWKLDEGAGTTSVDASGSANNLTFFNGATWGSPVVGASCLSLSGPGHRNQHAKAAAVNTSGGLTLAAWIHPTTLEGDHSIVTQISSYGFVTKGTGLSFRIPGRAACDTEAGLLTANQWQHVLVTFDPGSAGGVKFYVNGALKGTVDPAGDLPQNSQITYLGCTYGSDHTLFQGSLDDVRIYSAPMGGGDVMKLYKAYPAPAASNADR